MEASVFLAKFWGWYLLIFFLILSFNPKRIKQILEFLKDPKFLIITAFLATIIGLLNILFHNIWEPSWKIIITLIGWISFLMGLLLFVFPSPTVKWVGFLNFKLVQVFYIILF